MTPTIRFKKKVSKMGFRRVIEVPKDYYDVIESGDIVTIIAKEK